MCKLNLNVKAIFGTRGMLDKIISQLKDGGSPSLGADAPQTIYGVPIFVCDTDDKAFAEAYRYATDRGETAAALSEKESNFTTVDGAMINAFREEMIADCMKPRWSEPSPFANPFVDLKSQYSPNIIW